MKTQRSIAAELGCSYGLLEMHMSANKGANQLRLAWEKGRAKAEQEQIEAWRATKPTDKNPAAWIFGMKAQFAWKDSPDMGTGAAPRITYLLPGSMTEAEYVAKFGEIDSRPAHMRGGPPGGAPDMKDVTPGADGKLPTLGSAVAALPAPGIEAPVPTEETASPEARAAARLMSP